MTDKLRDIRERHDRDARHGAKNCAGVVDAKRAHQDRGELLNLLAAETARADGLQKQVERVKVIASECGCHDPDCECDWCILEQDILAALENKP